MSWDKYWDILLLWDGDLTWLIPAISLIVSATSEGQWAFIVVPFLSFLASMTLRKSVYWSRTGIVGILLMLQNKQYNEKKGTKLFSFNSEKEYRSLILPVNCSVYQHFNLSFLGFEMR